MDERRTTYIATTEHYDEVTLEIIDEIKLKDPNCQRVLRALEKHSQIADRPELLEIFLENDDELVKLVQTCLEPEKLKIKHRSWPYLAKTLLVKDPPVLLLALLRPNKKKGHFLFEFLKSNPNETARGYFLEMLHSLQYDFQDKLLHYMMEDTEALQLCLQKCYYPQVFSCLVSMIVHSAERQFDFSQKIFKMMLNKIDEVNYIENYAQNILQAFEQIHQNFQKLITNKFIDATEEQMLKKYCERIHLLASRTLDSEYTERVIRLCIDYQKKDEIVCESLLQVLSVFVRIFKQIPKVLDKISHLEKINPLEMSVVQILRNMASLGSVLRDQPKEIIQFSNSQEIQVIGMMKYHALELLEIVLTLEPTLVTPNYDLNKGKVLQNLQKFITLNPWNNIIHGLVQKIVINLINSFDRYSELSEDYTSANGFLGFLIETFRNHDYMFLNTGNLSNYGYIHYLYNIARAVCIKLKQSQMLYTTMEKFEPWQHFLVNDLQEYEKTLDTDLGGEPMQLVNQKKLHSHSVIRKIVVDLNKRDINQTAPDPGDVVNDKFVQVEFKTEAGREVHHRRNTFSSPNVIQYYREKHAQPSEIKKCVSQIKPNIRSAEEITNKKPGENKEDLKKYKIVLDETLEKKLHADKLKKMQDALFGQDTPPKQQHPNIKRTISTKGTGDTQGHQ